MSLIPFGRSSKVGFPADLINYPRLVGGIVQVLFRGWGEALAHDPPPTPAHQEVYMNGALAQGMRATIRTLGLTNIDVLETPGERSDPTLEVPDVEPDVILIVAQFSHQRLMRGIVECKRLDPLETPGRNLRGEYVREGMDRFIGERYGRGNQLCFMVGYVLRQDGVAAMADVNAYLQAVGRAADCIAEAPRYRQHGFVGESGHERPDDGPHLSLLHLFLTFPAGYPDEEVGRVAAFQVQ